MDQVNEKSYKSFEHPSLSPGHEGHKRSCSDEIKMLGAERLISSFTPPVFTRKSTGTVEDEGKEFHLQSQKILTSQSKRTNFKDFRIPSSHNTSENCTKKYIYLDSIRDGDWDHGVHLSSESQNSMNLKDSCDDLPYEQFFTDSHLGNLQPRPAINFYRHYRPSHMNLHAKSEEACYEYQNLNELCLNPSFSETYSEEQSLMREYAFELEKELEMLIEKWNVESEAHVEAEDQEPTKRTSVCQMVKPLEVCLQHADSAVATIKIMICNMPLIIAASALSWATFGIVWYKFGVEHLTMQGRCKVVNFYDPENTYPHEFPGSFSCDPTIWYTIFLYFHFVCHSFAALQAFIFILKVILSWISVHDELTNPVTATPVGVMCITLEILFAAAGNVGSLGVILTSVFHSIFAVWYVYASVVKFKLLPDPSWFPGTVGLAHAAVKTWLINNTTGKFFLGLCVSFFFGLYFISLVHVAYNRKIGAPVCWIQLSAPSLTLYATTIMAQPSQAQITLLEKSENARLWRDHLMQAYYLPFQQVMFILCLVGMASSLHSLWVRWDTFKEKPFSPAHLMFCFPTLSHTNAIQVYRRSIISFSKIPENSIFRLALYIYWIICLIASSIVLLTFTIKAVKRLPEWTKICAVGEVEPLETVMSEMLNDTREVINQPFISPAVLQANETGVLIRVKRGTEKYRLQGPYVRTRHVTSIGFDPTLSLDELREERAKLLDWVARNAPRTRNRTMSIPSFMKLKDNFGRGIYGSFETNDPFPVQTHKRSLTMSDVYK